MDIAKHWVSPKAYLEGVWLTYHPRGDKPVNCLIAAYNNPKHAAKSNVLLRPHIGAEDVERIYASLEPKALGGTVLLNWKPGEMVNDGVVVEFSEEAAERVLASVPPFCDWVRAVSRNMRNFREGAAVEVGKA